jgi:hypothetical protein
MSTSNIAKYAILTLASLFLSGIPALYAQAPSPAPSFNDSVSIFRETSTSDWPAVFFSPLPYDPQATSLEGLTFSVSKQSDGAINASFSATNDYSIFTWYMGYGASFQISPWGLWYYSNGRSFGLDYYDDTLVFNGENVLTTNSLDSLQSVHASNISVGPGSSAGYGSFAAGNGATTSGLYASALGLGTTAQGYNQFVIGQYNSPQGTGTANTNATDALFIIGNGSSAAAPSNAFVVRRNGDTEIKGKLIFASAGIAIGLDAVANGGSIGVGYASVAGGIYSVAIGSECRADGDYAVALGEGNSAMGIGSATMGFGTQATGFAASSSGHGTYAQGLNQCVIGSFNVISGSSHNSWAEYNVGFPTWDPNDEIFIIGNGVNAYNRSNALTVKKNAATGIGTGIVTTTASQTVVGKYNDTSVDSEGRSHGAGLFVIGMGQGTGTTPRKNALRVREDGTLLVRPAGDLSMGGFHGGEQP